MPAVDDDHFWFVADRLTAGRVVPFLGAGASLAQRPDGVPWRLGEYLPNGQELATELVTLGRYPDRNVSDLLRVSQYVDAEHGEGVLYEHLHRFFDANYRINSLHRFLAGLPPLLRAKGVHQQLIVTTNYDDLLERAFAERGEPYDLVWYEAKRNSSDFGKFIHRPPDGQPIPIDTPNDYDALSREEHTVILKLHGAVNRLDAQLDSYVITEDSYIAYLTRYGVSTEMPLGLPILLQEHMRESHFLFLGYSLRDWNLRVILSRIWGTRLFDLSSWAIQRKPVKPTEEERAIEDKLWEVERKLWAVRGRVDLFDVPLREYAVRLKAHARGRCTDDA